MIYAATESKWSIERLVAIRMKRGEMIEEEKMDIPWEWSLLRVQKCT